MYSTVSMNQPPKWSIQSNRHLQQQQQQEQTSSSTGDNTDDHYSRHLETVPNDNKNDGEDDHDEDANSADENGNNNEEEEEVKDDEPKVFQVEDVDLPSLITKPNSSKPTSPLINALKPADNNNFNKPHLIPEAVKSASVQMKSMDSSASVEANLVSTMATPVHYFSRSSSMTSLNSFDIKSIHSEIASEYSQVTSQVTSPGRRRDDFNHSDYLDDLENLNMPESPSALENSFLMAQRYIHKQQQVIYRQNAAVAMGSLNCGRQQNQQHQQHLVTINNVNLHQINKIMPIAANQTLHTMANNFRILKTTDTNQFNLGSVYANPIVFENGGNLVKPWTSSGHVQLQKKQSGNDLHEFMSRLNLQKPPCDNKAELTTGNSSSANRQAKAADSESSNSDTESDSSDSLSFLKENQQQQQNQQNANVNSKNGCHSKPQQPPLNLITNTPPVKLQATPKFIEPSKVVNFVHPGDTGIGQFKVNPPAGMSVSYAFMKNNNQINSTSCLPPNQDISNNQQKVLQPAQPQYISNLPKFLQTANQSYFPPASQQSFNQNPFSQQQQQPPNISSSSSSSSSQNSVIQQQLSPTNSDAPFVYMVEKTSKILTPQAVKTRPIHQQQSEDRPPSPQESVCSRMSDSSIPSIIKQELTKNTKPQNDFKALFNKLNQQSDINLQKQQAKQQQFLVKANNNLMPAFNFLKSSHTNFGAQPHQQAYFSNLNTPTNNNQHQANLNFSDLDCTYSPKVFQNEGTNSRYDTTDDEEEEEPSARGDTHHENLVQNSTVNEAKSLQLDQDDQDELLLENFIKEMLPPVNSTSPVPHTRSRMANSISSEAPFKHLASKTKIKSSGSSSSLNSLPVSKPRMNFSKNSEKSVKATATSVTRGTPQKNKAAISRTANTSVPVKQPEMPAKKTQPIATKVVTKVPTPVPVIAMTKTAQLRAKIASTNNNGQQSNTLNLSINNLVRSAKPKVAVAAHKVSRLKENINTTKTGSSVALNPHLDHLSRTGVRRKSFTCGATTSAAAPSPLCNKPLKKPNPIGDTSVSSLSNSTNSRAATTPAIASTKPKATWK